MPRVKIKNKKRDITARLCKRKPATNAERCCAYRIRKKLVQVTETSSTRVGQEVGRQTRNTRLNHISGQQKPATNAERCRAYRKRKKVVQKRMMECDQQNEPASNTSTDIADPTLTTDSEEMTPCSSIEMVDIKTEPPDTMEATEYSEKTAMPDVATAISIRIESITGEVPYETAKGVEQSVIVKIADVNPVLTDDVKTEETIEIKQEMDTGDVFTPEVSISYDIPTADQAGDICGMERSKGENLRDSLQEEIVLKVEAEDTGYEVADCPREEHFDEDRIKIEQSASTHHGGVTMQILPLDTSGNNSSFDNVPKIRLSSQSAPDQMTQLHVYNSDFQLNSITGDMLSLEQEAYGLLEAKNPIRKAAHPYVCTKCPKTCKDRHAFQRHLKVHETIERRADGVARGKMTRELNRNKVITDNINKKKEVNLMRIGTSKDLSLLPYHYNKASKEPRKGNYKCTNCDKQYRVLRCWRRHQRACQGVKVDPNIMIEKRIRRSEQKEKVMNVLKNDPKVEPVRVVPKMKIGMRSEKIQPAGKKRDNEEYKMKIRPGSVKIQPAGKKRDNEEYKCECGKTFSRRSRLETCLRSHHPEAESRTYSCAICSKSFKEKGELMQHKKRQHVKKKFLCKFCPMDYHTPKELFDHLRVHKKVQMMEFKVISEVVEGKQVLKCFICSRTFTELSELKAHVLVDHKEPYTCRHCRQNFPKIVDFATHTKTAHPEVEGKSVLDVLESFSILAQAWKCEECHVQFEDPDDLVKHQTEQHGPVSKKPTESEESSKFQFRCEDCRRTFVTLKQLSTHRDLHHTIKDQNLAQKDDTESTVPVRVPTPPPPLPMCVHCRKVCKDESTLTSHLRLHSVDRKYPCKFCDFRFTTIEKRKNHAVIHTGDMKYVCFVCEYRCSSENRLKYHKQSQKHLDLKEALLKGPPYEPQAPIIQPARPPEVKKKRHSSERKRSDSSDVTSKCDICGEDFPNEKTMLTHKDTHPFIVFPNEDEPTRIFFK